MYDKLEHHKALLAKAARYRQKRVCFEAIIRKYTAELMEMTRSERLKWLEALGFPPSMDTEVIGQLSFARFGAPWIEQA